MLMASLVTLMDTIQGKSSSFLAIRGNYWLEYQVNSFDGSMWTLNMLSFTSASSFVLAWGSKHSSIG